MLVRYPAAVKPRQVDSQHMVLNNDVAHTILDYCGVERPKSMLNHGESWRPILEGKPVQRVRPPKEEQERLLPAEKPSREVMEKLRKRELEERAARRKRRKKNPLDVIKRRLLR